MSHTSVTYVLEKATANERLYFNEALQLYQEADLTELGRAADSVRQQRVPGRVVSYLVDRNIDYTNVCVTNCQFCGYHRPPGHPDGFVRSRAELGEKIEELLQLGGTRLLLQGGHNPDLNLDWYISLLKWLRATYPQVERDCFSPSEVWYLAQQSGRSVREVLVELQDAGLQGLPGEGAEILDDEIRSRFSPKKQKTNSWLGVMREAQKLGLNTTATMVIGLNETPEHRIRHLQRVRDLQDYSLREHGNGFNAFVAWTLQPSSNASMWRSATNGNHYGATAEEYLRHIAVARLFLDNILHHQASWSTQEHDVVRQSLHFGIDDFGSATPEANVFGSSGAENGNAISEGQVHQIIREAGYTPARRDTAYNLLYVFENPDESPVSTQATCTSHATQEFKDVIPLHSNLN